MALRAEIQMITTTFLKQHGYKPPKAACDHIIINEEERDMYFVYEFNADDELINDYCYFSLEDAKLHGKEIYHVSDDSWYECLPPNWNAQ